MSTELWLEPVKNLIKWDRFYPVDEDLFDNLGYDIILGKRMTLDASQFYMLQSLDGYFPDSKVIMVLVIPPGTASPYVASFELDREEMVWIVMEGKGYEENYNVVKEAMEEIQESLKRASILSEEELEKELDEIIREIYNGEDESL